MKLRVRSAVRWPAGLPRVGDDVEWGRTTVAVSGSTPVRLSVIDTGPPPDAAYGTLICLHGAGGDAEQWRHQISHFRHRYRVIAPDLRGHGASDVPYSAYSLEEFLGDFTQLLDQLAVEPPIMLLAHSFGGPIALTFAAAQPQRIARLVLIATAPEIHLHPLYEAMLKLPLPLRMLERLRPLVAPKLGAPLFVIQRVLAGTLFPWRGWGLLPSVVTPTLIIGGQFDLLVRHDALQRMRSELREARLEIVRYTRHLPQLERPRAVNRHIEQFLERRRSWRDEEE